MITNLMSYNPDFKNPSPHFLTNTNTFTMEEFASSVNEFLAFRRYEILPDKCKGRISRQDAWKKAQAEYDIFNKTQIIHSDFDEMVKEVLGKEVGQNE